MTVLSPVYLILAILAMATVTFIIRALPALIPKTYLDTPWLHRLNSYLPLCVLILLILTSLQLPILESSTENTANNQLLLAQIIALTGVLTSYHFFKQLFVSMVVGIAILNACLWLFTSMSFPY